MTPIIDTYEIVIDILDRKNYQSRRLHRSVYDLMTMDESYNWYLCDPLVDWLKASEINYLVGFVYDDPPGWSVDPKLNIVGHWILVVERSRAKEVIFTWGQ